MTRSFAALLLLAPLLLAGCGNRTATSAVEPEQLRPQGRILTQPPATASPDERYLFYLHGKIIEDQGTRPRHPLHLGGGHGAFYRPASAWFDPLLEWTVIDP